MEEYHENPFEYTIKDELGIHARPAGLPLQKRGPKMSQLIYDMIEKGGKSIKTYTQLMMLMSLGAETGRSC